MFRQPGTVLTDHMFTVPLDHQKPGGEQIEVFAREVAPAGRRDGGAGLPWLVYLQGGPGFGSPRPFGRESWLNRALDDYRVLLLDQRGTGRSTPASRHTLARLGSPRAQADYLACFRADSIARDAELIRRRLLGDEPWTVLGQSFGGFCTVSYLSFAPEGIREALIGGGLPGLDATADDVYRVTYPIVAERNRRHYERFPMDADRARVIARHLASHEVIMPGGGRLTVPAFQGLGRMLGASRGSDTLHYLLEDAFAGPVLSSGRCCPTRSWPASRPNCPSPRHRCTPWCTRRVTPRGPRPAGPRTGSWPSSPNSTRPRPWTGTSRSCSPGR